MSSAPDTQPHQDALAIAGGVLQQEAHALAAIHAAMASGGHAAAVWTHAIRMIDQCKGHVVVSGMGKSGLVGAKLSATFSSLGIPSHVVHPADAVHGDLGAIRQDDVVMLLSYSGGTSEILDLATILKADGVQRLGMSRSDDTHLARLCTAHLSLGDLDEAGPLSLAPTTSTTATMACGDALALAVAHERSFTASDFRRRHPGGSLGMLLRPVEDLIRFRPGANLTTTTEDVSVAEAMRLVADDHAGEVRHAGAVLILDHSGGVAGLFTDGDLRRLVLSNPEGLQRPIGEVMTRDPMTLRRSATVAEARQMVAEHRIDEVPVIDDDGCAVGLIDIQDLIAPRVTVD